MSILMEYLREEAGAGKEAVANWFMAILKDINYCALCTHIGKFTDPSLNVNYFVFDGIHSHNGYVYTENVSHKIDVIRSAAYSLTSKRLTALLMLKLEDKKSVLSHFISDSAQLKQELLGISVDYDNIRANILQLLERGKSKDIDTHIRQVYFPVGKENYHLLSVLPPSSLAMEVKTRIDTMNDMKRQAKQENSEHHGQNYKKIFDLTVIKFGGNNSQNISQLCTQFAGKSYMFSSVPPRIIKRSIIYPKQDFFLNTLKFWKFRDLFHSLHTYYIWGQNNLKVKQRLRTAEEHIIDVVLVHAYRLQELPPGWSDAENNELPEAQRIWLDAKYEERRETETGWKQEIADTFARWILFTAYKRVMKDKAIALGDAEFSALRDEILDAL